MICNQIAKITGYACHQLDETGSVAMIETPFKFSDGDSVFLFVEKVGNKVRFFDDGAFLMHFAGRGVNVSSANKVRFISKACTASGAIFNDQGEAEAWGEEQNAGTAFAAMVGAAHRLIAWEEEHLGTSTDIALLVEDVAICMQALHPNEPIKRNPMIAGLSKQTHSFDFSQGDTVISAIPPHHASVGGLLRKLIDVKGSAHNQSIKTMVVVDDRKNKDAALREATVLGGVTQVMMMTSLVARTSSTQSIN